MKPNGLETNGMTSDTSFAALELADWKGVTDLAGMKASVADVPSGVGYIRRITAAAYALPSGRALRIDPKDGQTAGQLRNVIITNAKGKVRTAVRDGAVYVWRREQ